MKMKVLDLIPLKDKQDPACERSCSEECLADARQVIRMCSEGGDDQTRPDLQTCINDVRAFLGQRSDTSGDQGRADAVAYCGSGAPADCAISLHARFLSRRSSTTSS